MAIATAKRTKRDGARPRRSPTTTSTGAGRQGNWRATEIDFSKDRKGWEALSDDPAQVRALDLLDVLLRRGLRHRQPLSLHRRGTEEEQKYFLATQQVDEARHAVFFHRFFRR
jgi:ribonucleotide reductase beta subunit family protein with ferritin-like domain